MDGTKIVFFKKNLCIHVKSLHSSSSLHNMLQPQVAHWRQQTPPCSAKKTACAFRGKFPISSTYSLLDTYRQQSTEGMWHRVVCKDI